MGGDFGTAVSSYVGSAIGTVASVAMGGASLAAGAAGKALLASDTLQKGADSSNAFKRFGSQLGLLGADKLQNATFDPRNIAGFSAGAKALGADLGKGNTMTYAGQTKKWRENLDDREKKMANLTEVSEGGRIRQTKQEQDEFNASNIAHQKAKKGLELADKASSESLTGQAVAKAKKDADAKEKASAEAAKKAEDAFKALEKARANQTGLRNGATNRTFEEEGAEAAYREASREADGAKTAHSGASGILLAAEKTHSETDEGKAHAKAKEEEERLGKIATQKAADLAQANKEVNDRNDSRREAYAQRVEQSGVTASGRAQARARAEKVRKDNAAGKKAAKEEIAKMKKLAKILSEEGGSEPKPAEQKPEAAKPTP
jgi:hypothetical protein